MPKNEVTSKSTATVSGRVLKNKIIARTDKRLNKINSLIESIYMELDAIGDEIFEFANDAYTAAGSALTQAKDKKKV